MYHFQWKRELRFLLPGRSYADYVDDYEGMFLFFSKAVLRTTVVIGPLWSPASRDHRSFHLRVLLSSSLKHHQRQGQSRTTNGKYICFKLVNLPWPDPERWNPRSKEDVRTLSNYNIQSTSSSIFVTITLKVGSPLSTSSRPQELLFSFANNGSLSLPSIPAFGKQVEDGRTLRLQHLPFISLSVSVDDMQVFVR